MRDSEKRLARNRIVEVVRSVRWRWRTRQLLRGLLWVGGLTGLVAFASAFALERVRFAPEWVIAFRYATWGTLLLSTFFFLIRPFLKRASDTQVALYLEEHEPTLEHSVVSAIDEAQPGISPALREKVFEVAADKVRRVQYGRRAVFPKGQAKEDWAILRALSGVMGRTLPYDSLAELRARMIAEHPTFGQVDYAPGAADAAGFDAASLGDDGKLSNEPFRSPITDFYLTNPIARASKTMAECSRLRATAMKVAAE